MVDRTVALAQIDPVLGDLSVNVGIHCDFARRAAEQGADLIVFPELSLTGYTVKDMNIGLAIRTDAPPKALEPLLDISRTIPVLAGGIEEDRNFAVHNAAFLIEQGEIRSVHRKIYPPTYGMFEERRYFSPGDAVRPASSAVGQFGVLICEDLWHPSLPYLLAIQGVQVIIGLVASPTRVMGGSATLGIQQANNENNRTYARLLSSYVVFCNRVGFEDGTQFWGGSAVHGPDGSTLCQAALFQEDLILCALPGREVQRARQSSRQFLDEDPHFLARELQRFLELRARGPARGN